MLAVVITISTQEGHGGWDGRGVLGLGLGGKTSQSLDNCRDKQWLMPVYSESTGAENNTHFANHKSCEASNLWYEFPPIKTLYSLFNRWWDT